MRHLITRDHFSMNHVLSLAMVLFVSLICASPVEAGRVNEFTISAPENVSIRHEGGNVIVQMDMPLKMVKVTNNEAAIFTPVLKYGTHEIKLKSVGVYGRTRYYQYIRTTGLITGENEINFIRGTQPSVYQYTERIAFRPWMENAKLVLEQKLYECCEEIKDQTVIALNASMEDPNQLASNPSSSYSNSYYGQSANNSQAQDSPFFDINVTSDEGEAKANGTPTTNPSSYGEVTHVTSPQMTAAISTYGSTSSYSNPSVNQNTSTQAPPAESDTNWPPIASNNNPTYTNNADVQHVTTPAISAAVNVRGDTPSYATNPMGASSASSNPSYNPSNTAYAPVQSSNPQPQAQSNQNWQAAATAASSMVASNADVQHVSTPAMSAAVNVHGDTPSYATNPMGASSSSSNQSYNPSTTAYAPVQSSNPQPRQPDQNWQAAATAASSMVASNSDVQHVSTPAMSAAVNVHGDTPSYATNPMSASSASSNQTYNPSNTAYASVQSSNPQPRQPDQNWQAAATAASSMVASNADVQYVSTPAMSAAVNVHGDTPSYATNPMGASSSSSNPSYNPSTNAYAPVQSSNPQPQAQPNQNWQAAATAASTIDVSNTEVHHVTTPEMAASVNVRSNTPSASATSSSSYSTGNSNAYSGNSSSVNNGSSSTYSSPTSSNQTPVMTQQAVNNAPGAIVPQYLYYKVNKSKKAGVSQSDTVLIEFSQRTTELNPNYNNNQQVLEKLTKYIDGLKSNPDITLKSITLTTYSSPEGMMPDNRMMVEERVESIKSYLVKTCDLSASKVRTESVPENWDGLREYVAYHSMPHRDAILRLIDGPREPDNKEWVLKSTYADVYKTLLNDVYPGLRYTIVDYDFDVKKFNDPSQELRFVDSNNHVIPLDDIFLMAQQYPEGSVKSQEIYLKAAYYYSSNRKANYNAAVALLQGGKPEQAKKYIAAAGESPDVYYTRGLIYMALGDYQTARDYMKLAYNEGVLQADVIFQYLSKMVQNKTR